MRALLFVLLLTGCGEGCPLTRDKEVLELASVTDAPHHDRAFKALRFSAELQPELAGYRTWTVGATRGGGATAHTAAVIPAVPSGWTKADPIPAWIRVDAIAKDANDPAMKAKIDELVAAAAAGPLEVNASHHLEPEAEVDMDGTNAFQIGAYRAIEKHGLISAPGTPVCSWPLSAGPLRLERD